jgi:hypothetical protein
MKDNYLSSDEVYSLLDKIAQDFPEIAEPIEIGKTYQGNPIRGLAFAAP